MDKEIGSVMNEPRQHNPGGWLPKVNITFDDKKSMLILLMLYIVQGIPLGLSSTVPLIIYDRVSYLEMAYFAITAIPFCLKLLWAPIVESLYFPRFGKRKTWIIPSQLICGVLLIYGGAHGRLDRWVGEEDDVVHIFALCSYFTFLCFLMATQDIAVDGWALSKLRPEMRMYASSCNTAGQSIGINIAFVGFTVLSSQRICAYMYTFWIWLSGFFLDHSDISDGFVITIEPFATLSDLTLAFGVFTLVCTLPVFFQEEQEEYPILVELPNVVDMGPRVAPEKIRFSAKLVRKSYATVMEIMKKKPARLLSFVLVTFGLFFLAERPADLKLLEKGLSRDLFAALTPLMIPLEIFGPAVITMTMHKLSTADVLYRGMCLRLLSVLIYTVLIITTGIYYSEDDRSLLATALFYTFFLTVSLFRRFCGLILSVAFMSLFAQVSDPTIGGTYMTLLNTLYNFGEVFPNMLGLLLIDLLSHPMLSAIDALYTEVFISVLCGLILLPQYNTLLNQIISFEAEEWYVRRQELE